MKKKNNKRKLMSITIGTSALNEENMIGNFLDSLLIQEQLSFKIDKIIINSDGSTDNTVKIVKSYKNDKIYLIENKIRKGKTKRILEIFELNKSDILLILDADILLGTKETIENLVKVFDNPSVVLAGCNTQPIKSKTIVGKLLYMWEKIWFEIRTKVNNGDTILSLRGGAFAIKGNIAKQLLIPKSIHQMAEFIYFSIKQQGFSFKFAPNALVYYRQPETFKDYISTLSRDDNHDIAKFKKIFGKDIMFEYQIPWKQKYMGLLKIFIQSPLFTGLILGFIQTARIISRNKTNLDRHGFWPVTHSTKKEFTLKDI